MMTIDTRLQDFQILKNHPFVEYNCMSDADLRALINIAYRALTEHDGIGRPVVWILNREWKHTALKDYRYRKHVLMQGHEHVELLLKSMEIWEEKTQKQGSKV